MSREAFRKTLSFAKRIFTPIALGGIIAVTCRNWDVLAALISSAEGIRLVLVALIWIVLQLLGPFFVLLVLSQSKIRLAYGQTFYIQANRLPARYLPGGIWHTVGRAADYHALGVESRDLVLLFFLENALAPALAFLLGGLLLFSQNGLAGWGHVGAIAGMAGAVGFLAIPLIANRFILQGERLTLPVYAGASAVTILFWCGAATMFVIYLSAFPGSFVGVSPSETMGAYLFAWAVGNVALFAPQGLGVFEMVAGGILRGDLPLGGAAALMAGFRVVVLLADLATWAAANLGRFIIKVLQQKLSG